MTSFDENIYCYEQTKFNLQKYERWLLLLMEKNT